MKIFLKILLVSLLLVPTSAFATISVSFNATSTDKGYITPTTINGNNPDLFLQGNVGVGTSKPTQVNANARLTVAGISSQDVIASTTDNTTLSDAIMRVYAPGSSVFMGSHGTNQITSQYGIVVGGWAEIGAVNSSFGTSNGLLIGTRTTATPIVFGTNSLERMRILSTGAVGIGLTNPGSILEIQGTSTAATGQAFIAWDSNANRIFQIANNGSTTIGNFGTCASVATNSSGTFICGTPGGVTSLTAGAGIAVSASTGAITVTNTIGYPFPGNATSTLLSLTGGINASSTVNFQNGSTGSQFNWNSGTGRLGLGTSTPWAQFGMVATSTTGVGSPLTLFAIASTTGGTSTSTLLSVSNTGALQVFTPLNITNAFSVLNNASTNVFNVDTTGTTPALQIGTTTGSTPAGELSVIALFGNVPYNNNLFAVASSSQTSTTTLFTINNNGFVMLNSPANPANLDNLSVTSGDNINASLIHTGGEKLRFKAQDTKDRIVFSSAAGSNDGTLFFDSDDAGTNVMTLLGTTPRVGVASTSPWRAFGVNGTVAFNGLTVAGGNCVTINATTKEIQDGGSVTCATSSKYTKHSIGDIPDQEVIAIENALQAKEFTYNNDGTRHFGLIAEEVDALGKTPGLEDAKLLVTYAQEDVPEKQPDGTTHIIKKGQPYAIDYSGLSVLTLRYQQLTGSHTESTGSNAVPLIIAVMILALIYQQTQILKFKWNH